MAVENLVEKVMKLKLNALASQPSSEEAELRDIVSHEAHLEAATRGKSMTALRPAILDETAPTARCFLRFPGKSTLLEQVFSELVERGFRFAPD